MKGFFMEFTLGSFASLRTVRSGKANGFRMTILVSVATHPGTGFAGASLASTTFAGREAQVFRRPADV